MRTTLRRNLHGSAPLSLTRLPPRLLPLLRPPPRRRRRRQALSPAPWRSAARLWVEEELGLPWEIGRIYPLTEEEYAELLAVLTEAGEDFRQEAGETCLLAEPVE